MIGFPGQKRTRFQLGDVIFRRSQFAVELLQQIVALFGVGFLLRKIDVRLDVARKRSEFRIGGNLLFGAFAVAQHGLCGFRIAPKIRVRGARFEALQALLVVRGVKDSSGQG